MILKENLILKHRKNIIFQISFKDAFHLQYHLNPREEMAMQVIQAKTGRDIRGIILRCIEMFMLRAVNHCAERGRFVPNTPFFEGDIEETQWQVMKQSFEKFILPIVYCIAYNSTVLEAVIFNLQRYVETKLPILVDAFWSENTPPEKKTEMAYLLINQLLGFCCEDTMMNIYGPDATDSMP